MATSVVFPRVQFFADNGRLLIGGRIHTYIAGTSSRAPTYKDAARAQPNTNPIILDGRAEASIYLAEGVEYKFVVEDSNGALIMTQEPVYGAIWPNAEDWPSDATLAYQYMLEAKAAASAIGPIKFYDTYAQADGDLPNLSEDDLVEIAHDENRNGARTRYRVESGALVFVIALDFYYPNFTGSVPRSIQARLRDSISVKDFGAVGDGVVDDTVALRAWFNSLRSGDDAYIPRGDYLVSVTDGDLTDIEGANRNYAFLLSDTLSSVNFYGAGKIIFDTSSSSKRAFLFCIKNGYGINFSVNIDGTFDPQENVPNSEIGDGYGIYLYHCVASGLTRSRLRKLIQPLLITGQALAPATNYATGLRNYVRECHFEQYEQISTFGAGEAGLDFSHNHLHNAFSACKLSQNPPDDPGAVGQARNIIFSNNIVTWSPEFQFSEIWWNPGYSQTPCGLMIEGHYHNITVSDNIIDMSGARPTTLPLMVESGCVIALSPSDHAVFDKDSFQQTRLKIQGNVLIGYAHVNRWSVKLTAVYRNVEVTNNTCTGGVDVYTSSLPPAINYGGLCIRSNRVITLGTRSASIGIRSGNYSYVTIESNEFLGNSGALTNGDQSIIYLTGFTATHLRVANNIAPEGGIGTYGAAELNVEYIDIVGNSIKRVDLSTNGVRRINVHANSAVTNSTAFRIVLDALTKANAIIKFSGNSCSGKTNANSSTAVSLNGGKLKLDGNSFDANAGTAFSLDASVSIISGSYYGQGAPSQQAQYGVLYCDYNAGSDAAYIKTTVSGSSGWKKLATV